MLHSCVSDTALPDTGEDPCVTGGFLCLTQVFCGLWGCVLVNSGSKAKP